MGSASSSSPPSRYTYTWTPIVSPPDLSQLAKLVTKSFVPSTHRPATNVEAWLVSGSGLRSWLLAREGLQVVGAVATYTRDSAVLIANLAVDSNHRRRGIATELMQRVEDRYPTTTLRIEVERNVPPFLQRFYLGRGYELCGQLGEQGRYRLEKVKKE